jgi:ribosomal protein S18 acetylase RimI-like enzyme
MSLLKRGTPRKSGGDDLTRTGQATEMHDVEQLSVERASEGDAAGIAKLYLASRTDALPYLHRVHTDPEVYAWISDVVLKRRETWVARLKGDIVGFMVLVGDELDQLYVLPEHYRSGIGRKLLDLAKTRSPVRLHLYTFQRNVRARAFYEAQGFRIIDMNDGTRNEEKEPDIGYEWTPTQESSACEIPLAKR